jgi:hypothetical protein
VRMASMVSIVICVLLIYLDTSWEYFFMVLPASALFGATL